MSEKGQDLGKGSTLVRFTGDIRDACVYGPEAIRKLEVGATVTVAMPNDSGIEFKVTKVTRDGGEIIARVESGRSARM